ncbi:antifungal protein ginkbilobin-like protein [Punica granatum]|uniref:Antifungal protein ginkbilobin-like protein n=1 Tax=Punica granatum TaxID=22663 RepID=A0A6P8DIF7_PUNGR|nr:antifungal protein ginkbilobin-like protein [Punica granatum]
MDSLVRAAAIVVGLLCMFDTASYSTGAPDLTVLSKICNGQQFRDKNTRKKVDNVLVQVINNAPDHGYSYYASSDPSNPTVYGHAACNGQLPKEDCVWCLVAASDELSHDCPKNPVGAQVHLQDCRLRIVDEDLSYLNFPPSEIVEPKNEL